MLFDHCLDKAWVGFCYDVCNLCNNLNVGWRNTDKLGDAQCTAVDLFLPGCCFNAAIARCSGSTGVLRMCGEPPEKLRKVWHAESETGQGPCILVAPGGLCGACARNPGFCIPFRHFLSFFVVAFLEEVLEYLMQRPIQELMDSHELKTFEPGGKAIYYHPCQRSTWLKTEIHVIFRCFVLILFCSRPAASLLTVSQCYAEQRSEGTVMRWCFFNT